ncbi:MAG: TRAP transporter small permease subunit [Proteobacteria bacterium]|nr:TRAP transporter small permease subunit [Pseudomonadota bacterium]
MVTFLFLYLINNYLVFWQGWPGVSLFFSHQGWIIFEVLDPPLPENLVTLGWIQLIAYLAILISVLTYVLKTEHRTLREDSMRFTSLAAYVVQVAFWMVFLIGMVDTVISFLRVEGFLANLVSQDLLQALGRPNFRGTYVHYPLMGLSLVVAWFIRSLSFIWLAYMVVMAEFLIVISRFVFSYEQAFMGDIVRFWYAALFLFASSYTLLKEGHVRVDVLYAHFPKRKKAISNIAGSLFLGIPLCWVILTQGMAGKASSLNAPLINFEISQSGYGLYTKYLMAGFMIIFAVSMMIQFVSDLLGKVADLEGEAELSEEMN